MNNFIIASYYTINTPYQQVAHDFLMRSLENKNIKTDVRGVENRGSWQANTSYKPRFLLQMLEKHPESNIVFLDADAEVLEHPALFDSIPEEYPIAVHYLDRDAWYRQSFGGSPELLSGTMFLRNCAETLNIVQRWIDRCNRYPSVWEQKLLHEVLEELAAKVYNLPIHYCYIASLPNGDAPHVVPQEPIVIRHNQVSRTLRTQV